MVKNVTSIIYVYLIYQSSVCNHYLITTALFRQHWFLHPAGILTLSPPCTPTQTLLLCTWLPHCLDTFYTLWGGDLCKKSPPYITWVSISPARLLPVLKLSFLWVQPHIKLVPFCRIPLHTAGSYTLHCTTSCLLAHSCSNILNILFMLWYPAVGVTCLRGSPCWTLAAPRWASPLYRSSSPLS